jgi:HD-like signal output (HDOD) protein
MRLRPFNRRWAGEMNTASDTAATSISITRDESFAFVQALANELSEGKVELAGFPDVAVRVQRVLADEEVATERVVQVIGSEPILAAQLLQISNSVALNPVGKAVTDLRTAVARVGLNIVRTTTIAFAVRQLRNAAVLKPIEKQLSELWQRNVLIASLCHVLARRFSRVNADTALLTGMLHGIGRLYIMTRAIQYPALFANLASYQAIERDWHLSVATALLENWEVADEIVQAVRDSADLAREPRGPVTLTDILVTANLIVTHQDQPELLGVRLQSVKTVARLQLDSQMCEGILRESAAEIAALCEALG